MKTVFTLERQARYLPQSKCRKLIRQNSLGAWEHVTASFNWDRQVMSEKEMTCGGCISGVPVNSQGC